jgi:hypothetical protein
MTSQTFSPVEAAVLGEVLANRSYRSELYNELDYTLVEIDRAIAWLETKGLIRQWGSSLGRSKQFFLVTGLGVLLHNEYAAQMLDERFGVVRHAAA